MTQLARYSTFGLVKESSLGTYAVPSVYLPFSKIDFENMAAPIKDESFRGNDALLQGLYQGVREGDWSIDLMAYPDLMGHFLRSIIGPDTVTPGIATTLSAATTAGATTITTAVTVPMGTYLMIDTGANVEYCKTTAAPTGTGPYTLTVSTSDFGAVGLSLPHSSGATVASPTTHSFQQTQNPALKATYSFTVFDTFNTYSYSDAVCSDLQIKVDPKGAMTLNSKWKSMPQVSATATVASYTSAPPILGWEWKMVNGGAASDRGLTFDMTIKRTVDVIHSSNGLQAPREIFQGPIDVSCSYKAIFENLLDMNLYENYVQQPTTLTMQAPTYHGGASIALTMSKSGYNKGKRDIGNGLVEAQYSIEGIYNTTDAGVVSAVLKNYVTTQY